MKHRAAENHLKTHRKTSGLSQREMGELLGYKDTGQVSRHERAKSVPPLANAIAYEVIFRVPVTTIFVGMHGNIKRVIDNKLHQLEVELGNSSARGREANLVAQKLVWLNERRRLESEPPPLA